MLEITRRSIRMHGLSRRSFLRTVVAGLTGLTLPGLLRARQAQEAAARKDTAVILFWMAGGPSHIDMYDMKPDAPAEVRGPFAPIATNLPGLPVCELMPRHVGIADKLAVIRSIRHDYGVHDDAQHLVQTGYALLNARQRGQQHPAEGSVASFLRGPNAPGMPAYVCLPEDYATHAGFYQQATYLGSRHNALNGGGDPSLGNYRPPEFNLPSDMSAPRLAGRRGLLESVDLLARQAEAAGVVAGMDDAQRQALELVLGSKAREAFDLTREEDATRERYGRHAYGQSALLARRLVEAGVTFVTINLYEKDIDWWDDHYTIEKNLRKRLPVYDQALATLIEDIHERGLADRVLVAAYGEFGRAPRVDSYAGRGHWPWAMSAVLSGGGVRGGQIIGSTTADGGQPLDRALVPGDLLASVYKALGIDHETFLTDLQDRPVRLIEAGKPIAELF